ncbi:putative N-acetyltransferase p20 [Fusarium oxysporum f. sp. cubense]|uniref:Putative N-acetyltransferase p20 n=1 Tax=Fusarium oxysporum f. sp. cubense TaxID=61366 RepID=A0A559L7N2_FUSOC|nr:putative N-acetyltransferase p20 [Fusarium oxysporum f. sp. cubense]
MASTRKLTATSSTCEEPGAKILETQRLILRRFYPSDAEVMSQAADNKSVSKNMRDGFPSPYTLAHAESFINNVANNFDGAGQHCGIFVKANTIENPSSEPVFVGTIGMMAKNDVYFRTWEMGYWLAETAWGKGYATEAAKALIRWCFETWPELNRIEACANGGNKASQNVLRKSGLVEEGTRRGAVCKNGEILDEVLFGLLRSEL